MLIYWHPVPCCGARRRSRVLRDRNMATCVERIREGGHIPASNNIKQGARCDRRTRHTPTRSATQSPCAVQTARLVIDIHGHWGHDAAAAPRLHTPCTHPRCSMGMPCRHSAAPCRSAPTAHDTLAATCTKRPHDFRLRCYISCFTRHAHALMQHNCSEAFA